MSSNQKSQTAVTIPLSKAVKSAAKSKKSGDAVKKTAATSLKRIPSDHPLTSVMVNNAVRNLKDRGGSSLRAIKKYICSTYKVDPEKVSPLIKKYLKSAVSKGDLICTKGTGASGSFKLATTTVKSKSPKKASVKSKTTKSKTKQKTKKSTKKATSSAKKSLKSASKTPVVKKLKVKAKKKPAVKKVVKKSLKKK